jgi:hypothetical protein
MRVRVSTSMRRLIGSALALSREISRVRRGDLRSPPCVEAVAVMASFLDYDHCQWNCNLRIRTTMSIHTYNVNTNLSLRLHCAANFPNAADCPPHCRLTGCWGQPESAVLPAKPRAASLI